MFIVTRGTVLTNLLWKFAERCGAQGISFVVSIVLARMLMPEDYGLIALVMIFINLLGVFIDSGFGRALIQKKGADTLDFSSVFYVQMTICLCLYVLMFFAAPWIADFYAQPGLASIVRVLSISLIFSGLNSVQYAYVSRHMIFKRFFYTTIGANLCSAIVGISMAYQGFGVWSLVAQSLTSGIAGTLILWKIVPWHPQLVFSLARVRDLFSFGWKLLASGILDAFYNQLWQLIIGKVYTPAELAFYNRGHNFPNIIVSNIDASINSVLLPVMSSEQDDIGRVRMMTRRAIMTSIFIMAPMMMLMAFAANNIIILLLTEKWLPAMPFLCIFCVDFMFYPVHTANLNAIQALGRSDIFLKLEIVKKVVGFSILLITMPHGVLAMAYGMLAGGVCSQIINSWPNRRLLEYGYLHQLQDFFPSVLLAVVCGVIVHGMNDLGLTVWLTLLLQVTCGAVLYFAGAWLMRMEPMMYIVSMVRPMLAKLHG